jgi:thioredoxin 1
MKKKVLFFSAEWCNGCANMKQKFYDEVRRCNIKYDVVDVDTEDGAQLSCVYGVRNVPTLVFLKGNKVIGVEKGNTSYLNISKYV